MNREKRHELVIGGTGGQGVITIAYALASAAAQAYPYVTRFPIYMATQRGGPAFATVIFSDQEIASPLLSRMDNAIAMESGAYARLKKEVKPNGRLLVNSSIVKKLDSSHDYQLHPVPVTDIAHELGNPKMANIVMLGAYLEITKVFDPETMLKHLGKDAGPDFMEAAKKAMAAGADHARAHPPETAGGGE